MSDYKPFTDSHPTDASARAAMAIYGIDVIPASDADKKRIDLAVFDAARNAEATKLDDIFIAARRHTELYAVAERSLNLVLGVAEPHDFIGILQATANNPDTRALAAPHIARVLNLATTQNVAAILPILKIAATRPEWKYEAGIYLDKAWPKLQPHDNIARAITDFARDEVPEYARTPEQPGKHTAPARRHPHLG